MQKNMRGIIDLAQFLGRDETRKNHAIIDLEYARQFLEIARHWPLTGNRQRRVWVMRQKSRERVQRRGQTFFLDQSTGLKETPFAAGGKFAFTKGKFLQRDARAHDVDLAWVAAELDHGALQRRGARKNPGHSIEHLF